MDVASAWWRIAGVTVAMVVAVPVPRAVVQDHAHAVVLGPGPVLVVHREAVQSPAAARSRRTVRNPRKSLAHVHVRTNHGITANRNHALDHQSGIVMSHALAHDRVLSRILALVQSQRTTSRARALVPAHAHHALTLDPAIVRSLRTSPTTSLDRHHPKITITLQSVMKAWKIRCVCIDLTVSKTTYAGMHIYFIHFTNYFFYVSTTIVRKPLRTLSWTVVCLTKSGTLFSWFCSNGG